MNKYEITFNIDNNYNQTVIVEAVNKNKAIDQARIIAREDYSATNIWFIDMKEL